MYPHSKHPCVLGVLGGSTWRLQTCQVVGEEKPVLAGSWGLLCTEPSFPPWQLGICVCEVLCTFPSTVGVLSSSRASLSWKNTFHIQATTLLKKNLELFTKGLMVIVPHVV